MNVKKLICMLMCCFVLTSCASRITKYTSEDATQYNLMKTKTTKAKMIDVKTVNNDTIWTFQESYDRGLQWQTIDHHYFESASMSETNTLTTNYTVVVLDYYLKQHPEITEAYKVSYTYIDGYKFAISFTKEFDSRQALQDYYDVLASFLDTVREENANYSDKSIDYQMSAQFINGRQTIHVSDFTDFEPIDTENLSYNIVYDLQDRLLDYTNTEIDTWKQQHTDTHIYVREEDGDWQPTAYYTFEKSFTIASTVFYDYLQTLQLEDIEIVGDRDSYTVRKDSRTYGVYQNSMISFYEAQRICSRRFNIEKNIRKQIQRTRS